jgi:hypothetical protein
VLSPAPTHAPRGVPLSNVIWQVGTTVGLHKAQLTLRPVAASMSGHLDCSIRWAGWQPYLMPPMQQRILPECVRGAQECDQAQGGVLLQV